MDVQPVPRNVSLPLMELFRLILDSTGKRGMANTARLINSLSFENSADPVLDIDTLASAWKNKLNEREETQTSRWKLERTKWKVLLTLEEKKTKINPNSVPSFWLQ